MNKVIIDAFLNAAVTVLEGEAGGPVEHGAIRTEQGPLSGDDVTVIIGLSGALKGVVLVSMPERTVLRIASRMAGFDMAELDEMAKSTVAELTNMISGSSTANLEMVGYTCNISAPTVIVGKQTEISVTSAPRVMFPLQTGCGSLMLHVSVRTED